ncbi:hypothetical protein BRADI_1g57427v3, partial [Brachypodium distachyon]
PTSSIIPKTKPEDCSTASSLRASRGSMPAGDLVAGGEAEAVAEGESGQRVWARNQTGKRAWWRRRSPLTRRRGIEAAELDQREEEDVADSLPVEPAGRPAGNVFLLTEHSEHLCSFVGDDVLTELLFSRLVTAWSSRAC